MYTQQKTRKTQDEMDRRPEEQLQKGGSSQHPPGNRFLRTEQHGD